MLNRVSSIKERVNITANIMSHSSLLKIRYDFSESEASKFLEDLEEMLRLYYITVYDFKYTIRIGLKVCTCHRHQYASE